MPTKSQQLIAHAARLLDLKSDVPGAERSLRKAIHVSHQESSVVDEVQASSFLAELLVEVDRTDEALGLFQTVLAKANSSSVERDLLEREVRIAREHLAKASLLE